MQDPLGNELRLGDLVIHSKNTRVSFTPGVIVRFKGDQIEVHQITLKEKITRNGGRHANYQYEYSLGFGKVNMKPSRLIKATEDMIQKVEPYYRGYSNQASERQMNEFRAQTRQMLLQKQYEIQRDVYLKAESKKQVQ